MRLFELNQGNRGFVLDKAFEVRHREVGDGGDAWWLVHTARFRTPAPCPHWCKS